MPTALGDVAFELKVFSDVGLLRPIRPDRLARVVPAGGAKMVSFWFTRRNSNVSMSNFL